MGIKFDGVELLLEDDAGVAADFIERFLSTSDSRIWSPPQIYNSGQSSRLSNLSTPNYPEPPRFKLNSLYWPTGATRWGFIHCLASDSMKDKLLENQENDNTAKTLELSDEINETLFAEMYMLPPRPITCVELEQPEGNDTPPQTTENLWLITLVDQRYYWQFRTTQDIQLSPGDGWEELIDHVAELLEITITKNPIHEEWGFPDSCLLGIQQQNIAIVLEAIASSLGRRLICEHDGEVVLLSWDASEADDPLESFDSRKELNENLEKTWYQAAGDDFSDVHVASVVPEKVCVAFHLQDCVNKQSYYHSAEDFESNGDDDGTVGYFSSWMDKIIVAIYDTATFSSSSQDKFESLSKRIADAYFCSILNRYDRTFIGLMPWSPCGWDDAIEWSIGRVNSSGHREAQTRVRSLPQNFYAFEQYHRFEESDTCCKDMIKRGQTLASYITIEMTQEGGSGQNCIQTLTLHGSPTGGLHQIKTHLQKTAGLTFDCSASEAESALEALSSIGTGNVSAGGGPLDSSPITIEFIGVFAGSSFPLMKSWFGKLEGGESEILKGDFGYVAKLTGDLGAEEVSYESLRVYNRFSDILGNLQCLYANTGAGDELIQVECVEE